MEKSNNLPCFAFFSLKILSNKKVLLRKRKRHTARRVVSTPSVVLPGYPPPGEGYLTRVPPQVPRGGTRVRSPPRGYLGGYLTQVHPPGGVPDPGPPGGGPGTPPGGSGYPPGGYLGQVPPRGGGGSGYPPPPLPHGILGNVAKHYGIWVPPPPVDRQIDGWTDACQNITFPRTTYAGGKYRRLLTLQPI